MLKKLHFSKFIKKTNSLKNNYKIFLKRKKRNQYTLQSFQRKRQDYFFFKKSMKNIMQFLFKKGEKKKVFNLLRKLFLTKNNNKFDMNKNYKLYKSFYKTLFSNTPYMNFLNIPPKSKKRFRGRRGRKNKRKILFLVPILPRVQKRLQASWFLKSILKNNNLNLNQNFFTELSKAYKSREWMLKESSDFYNSAVETFLRFGRKSIKLYKKKKKLTNSKKNKSWKWKRRKKNFYSSLILKHKRILNKKIFSKKKRSLKKFRLNVIKSFSYSKNNFFTIKTKENLKTKKKKFKKRIRVKNSKKKINNSFSIMKRKINLDSFLKLNNKQKNFSILTNNDKTLLSSKVLTGVQYLNTKDVFLESSLKNYYNLKKLNFYRPFNITLRLFAKKNKLKEILKYNNQFDLFWTNLRKKEELLSRKKQKEEERLKKIEEEQRLLKSNKFLRKKIISKSLKWFKI